MVQSVLGLVFWRCFHGHNHNRNALPSDELLLFLLQVCRSTLWWGYTTTRWWQVEHQIFITCRVYHWSMDTAGLCRCDRRRRSSFVKRCLDSFFLSFFQPPLSRRIAFFFPVAIAVDRIFFFHACDVTIPEEVVHLSRMRRRSREEEFRAARPRFVLVFFFFILLST